MVARRSVSGPAWTVLTLALGACAPSLSTLEPARTTPAGHLQMTTSLEYTHTDGAVREVLDAIEDMDADGRLGRGELEQVADATSVALVQPPAVGYQVSAAYGVSKRIEIGVGSSLNTVRGWTRLQLLREPPGWYAALGFGVAGYLYAFPIEQFTDEIDVEGYTRWDLAVPLHFGFSHTAFHVWTGPKVLLSTYDARLSVCLQSDGGNCLQTADVMLAGTAAYLGGQLGLALGWERIWVAAELTVAHLVTDGNVTVSEGSTVERRPFDLDGTVLSPALGLIAWF